MLFDTDSGGAKYEIQKSLRFRASALAYLSRTPSAAGNQTTWSLSFWVKRGALGSNQTVFHVGTNNGPDSLFYFGTGDTFDWIVRNAGQTVDSRRISTQVFRDSSAHYHFLCVWDTGNGTAGQRMRVFCNGTQITSFSTATDPALNLTSPFNSAAEHRLGCNTSGVQPIDGYPSEINFIDGQALDPSYFGEVSAETGAWVPKKYTGTYGTNGFYLPFNDGSSLANLTADKSGNGNNWTAYNFSLTAGVTYDWMDDTPSNNFAVLNPLSNGGVSVNSANLSNTGGNDDSQIKASVGMSSGKWYWEVFCLNISGTVRGNVGISANPSIVLTWLGNTADSYSYFSQSGVKFTGGVSTAYGATFATSDTIGVAYDADAGSLTFYKNNVSQGVAFSGLSGTFFPAMSTAGGGSFVHNFGQRPFAYTPPAGFKALCTKNLPAPSILNPKKHFDVKARTGTGAGATITGIQFAPDLVWIKARGNAQQHILQDSARGVTKFLSSNLTTAEAANVNTLTSFNSDGYTIGSEPAVNQSSITFVDWLWKAGGAPVTNSAGSIQSQVSANPQAGFSIVTYTGTGANATVGHGLGVAPRMIIVKSRSIISQWAVYHQSLGNTNTIYLNLTNAVASQPTFWNSTSPTSSTVSLGTDATVNGSASTYVAYCFSEIPGYSKFGSYVGNGSADGPFVYCGFRPRYVLIKRVDAASTWVVLDTARNPTNVAAAALYPNLSDAEGSGVREHDFLANGFKIRSTGAALNDHNTSGGSYIFIAFAEQPFQFANAR